MTSHCKYWYENIQNVGLGIGEYDNNVAEDVDHIFLNNLDFEPRFVLSIHVLLIILRVKATAP